MAFPLLAAAAPIIGKGIDWLMGNQEAQRQADFAKHGIQWRVEDAKAAGIHPLYALGASTTSYSPQNVGGPSFAEIGQDLSRAIDATRNTDDKIDARLAGLQLERAGLENELLRSQILGSKAALLRQNGPPMPTGPEPSGSPLFWNDELWRGGVANRNTPAQFVENDYGEGVGDTWGLFSFLNNYGNAWMLQQALQVAAQKERARRGLPVYGVGLGTDNSRANAR